MPNFSGPLARSCGKRESFSAMPPVKTITLAAYLVELGGADAIIFTGGIGENRPGFRATVCANLEELGIVLDPAANESAKGEAKISAPQSRVQIWVMPTNEELIVARLAERSLSEG